MFPINKKDWTSLGKRIESQVRRALFTYDLLENQQQIAVALSGGKDSLTLLSMLAAISGRGTHPFKLTAIHVHGAFSCGAGIDTRYLEQFCGELNVPLISCEAKQTLETLACYSCSRQRRSLIFNAAKEAGATHIAFGHHRDDHVQTLLMNLLHKAEFEGNLPKVPMERYGVTIIRPLFYVSEEEIRTFAKQQGFLRIMCRCPVGQNSTRRKAEELIQELETLFPNARKNLAQAGINYSKNKALQP